LDDIHLNGPMETFWKSITLDKKDITLLAHVTGTGLVEFS
jgi:hypothetical protein